MMSTGIPFIVHSIKPPKPTRAIRWKVNYGSYISRRKKTKLIYKKMSKADFKRFKYLLKIRHQKEIRKKAIINLTIITLGFVALLWIMAV